jgi:hypothetical protein
MQDRINRVDETSCTARPDHTVGSDSVILKPLLHDRSTPISGLYLSRLVGLIWATSGHPGWMGSWFQPANYLILR